jgi:hypothetical protein
MNAAMPLLCPVYLPGQEPMPAGTTAEERAEVMQAIKYQKMLGSAMESCPLKVVMSGGAGQYSLNLWFLAEILRREQFPTSWCPPSPHARAVRSAKLIR